MIGNRVYDVAVVGGGVAGCSAAISSAREGKSVLLLERALLLGGLATCGLVNWWEPMCDGRGRQLIFGISEEMLKRAILHSYNTVPACWKSGTAEERILAANTLPKDQSRYVSRFLPTVLSLVLLDWLKEEGVDVVFDALLTDVSVKNGAVTSLRFATQNGFERVRARAYIDATGSAEVFFRGNFPTEEGKNAVCYFAHTAGDGDCRKWKFVGGEAAWEQKDQSSFLTGTSRENINHTVQSGQLRLYREYQAGKVQEITALPTMPQFRTIRRIVGKSTLRGEDANAQMDDALCVGGDFTEKGKWFEIPYSAFYCEGAKNLVAAGRIISAIGQAWNATRVIPIAALTGEVAGVIAARAVEEKKSVSALEIKKIREDLQSRGILIHG